MVVFCFMKQEAVIKELMKKKQSTNFVSMHLQPSRDFIHRPQGSALRGKYCYIPNFAKCSLVPCSDSTPIPSPILIIISSVLFLS